MNNLNDPPRMNIDADAGGRGAGGGNGNQWSYALLVPMLGLAAFRWIWNRESQKEIQQIRTQNDEAAALCKLELKKEKRAGEGCKQVLVKQLMKQVQLQQVNQVELEWYHPAMATLKELEGRLVERQNVYCSYIKSRNQRLKLENDMLLSVDKDPIGAELGLESDLRDIFKNDKHCADLLNADSRKNGSLMWVYLKYWQKQVTEKKRQKVEEAILGGEIKVSH